MVILPTTENLEIPKTAQKKTTTSPGSAIRVIMQAAHGFRCLPWEHRKCKADSSGVWGPRAERLGLSLDAYTPAPSNPSSTGALDPSSRTCRSEREGRLFLGAASGLDAFSPYPSGRSCPAAPCRTTGRPEAPASRSSRTEDPFPSDGQHPQQIKSDLSHDGLNPAHDPF